MAVLLLLSVEISMQV